jgi:TRAP-type mannitol/chloroaromatic compound transport system substrate-binding protein
VFDAVSGGVADMYHSAEFYWQKHSPGFNFFTAVPFGLTADEMAAWIRFDGGQELWDELSGGYTGVQMGGWFTKEVTGSGKLPWAALKQYRHKADIRRRRWRCRLLG